MDARPDVLAEQVRQARIAIDGDLGSLRDQLPAVDPRRIGAPLRTRGAMPLMAAITGAAACWRWVRRRRSYRTLEDLLVKELSDLLASEERLLPALERMRAQAAHPDLELALDHHRRESARHIDRLTRAFRSIAPRRRAAAEAALASVLEDAERALGPRLAPDVRDAWLLAAAQRAAHVQFATYGTARSLAATLGFQPAAALLEASLDEQHAAGERYARLATRLVSARSLRSRRA